MVPFDGDGFEGFGLEAELVLAGLHDVGVVRLPPR